MTIDILLPVLALLLGVAGNAYYHRKAEKQADRRQNELTKKIGESTVGSQEGVAKKIVALPIELQPLSEGDTTPEIQVDDWRFFLVRASEYFREHDWGDGASVIVRERDGTRRAKVVRETRHGGHQLFYRMLD